MLFEGLIFAEISGCHLFAIEKVRKLGSVLVVDLPILIHLRIISLLSFFLLLGEKVLESLVFSLILLFYPLSFIPLPILLDN